MTLTREEIMAYVDGEGDADARERIAAMAAANPVIAGQIAAERALRQRLQAHFAPVLDAPLPPEWAALIERVTQGEEAPAPQAAPPPAAPARIVSLATERARRETPAPRPVWRSPWVGAAVAASLVLGVMVGLQWQRPGPIEVRGGALVASGDLARALDRQLASARGDTPIRVLGSFQRNGGSYCRAFAGADAAGIACRAGDRWQLQHLLPGSAAPTDKGSSDTYRQAGSADGAVMALAQDMAASAPLDAAQEDAARAKGWH